MKKEFIGFYMPQEEALKTAWFSDNTLFVFDTNVLIKLYSYQPNTVKDFFSIVEKLGDKIWLPHQVGLEFQTRRLDIKAKEKKKFKELNNHINEILDIEKKIEQKFLKGRFPKLDEATQKLFEGIRKQLDIYKKIVNECDDEQPHIRTHDIIREQLDKYFEGKVGEAYTQDKLSDIYTKGEERYKNKIPPGFKDNDKQDTSYFYKGVEYKRKFGDLILWQQIIDKTNSDNKIKNVIFITDDEKEDWWFIVDEDGKKAIGPQANLTHEIMENKRIDLFYMYNTSAFFKAAKEFTLTEVDDNSIEEINLIHQQNDSETIKSYLLKSIYEVDKYKNESDYCLKESIWDRIRKHGESASGDILTMQTVSQSMESQEELKRQIMFENMRKLEELKRRLMFDEIEDNQKTKLQEELKRQIMFENIRKLEELKRRFMFDEIEDNQKN